MNVKASLAWLLITLLGLSVASCGFHLRGQFQIPESLQYVVIRGTVGADLLTSIKKQFIKSGINIVDDFEEIPLAYVTLSNDRYDKRVNSLSTTGQIYDYSIRYSVIFNVSASKRLALTKNTINIPDQKVQVSRILTVDPNTVLASGNEESIIKKEMKEELARSILFRIQALTKRKESNKVN